MKGKVAVGCAIAAIVGLFVSLLLAVTFRSDAPSKSVPLDNHADARSLASQIMERLRREDTATVAAVMTPTCRHDESLRRGGWLKNQPNVSTFRILGRIAPGTGRGAAIGYRDAAEFEISYSDRDGHHPYDGNFDTVLLVKGADGSWLMADRGGFAG